MRQAWTAAALAALALAASSTGARAASLLTGTWQSSCGDTCFDSHGVYSVTFSASQFSGPVDISRLGFDRAILGAKSGQFFNVSFQLGGHTVGSWGDWNMGGVAGDELFVSGQSLTWNPADGDLVLVFELVNANGEKLGTPSGGGGGSFSFTDAPQGGGDGSTGGVITLGGPNGSLFTNDGPPPPPDGGSDVIGDVAPGVVPEPSAWLLSIGGMVAAGSALRRRRPLVRA